MKRGTKVQFKAGKGFGIGKITRVLPNQFEILTQNGATVLRSKTNCTPYQTRCEEE